jgi:hypothetical protein
MSEPTLISFPQFVHDAVAQMPEYDGDLLGTVMCSAHDLIHLCHQEKRLLKPLILHEHRGTVTVEWTLHTFDDWASTMDVLALKGLLNSAIEDTIRRLGKDDA